MPFLSEQPIRIINKMMNGLFLVPNGQAILTIEMLLKGLCWIHEDFMSDCKRYDSVDIALHDADFIVRNTTRTLAYCNHASLLEGLVGKTYKELTTSIKHYFPSEVPVGDIETKIELQKIGFDRTETFRHKVSAHLSYVDPRKDNFSTQITSLGAILHSSCSDKQVSSFTLGGVQMVVGGKVPDPEIPPINISVTHNFLRNHYEKWGTIFDEVLRSARKHLPIRKNELEIS